MLALKQGLSLTNSNNPSGSAWNPTSEASVEAWYQKSVGITLNGSNVRQWSDSSGNGLDMVQATAGSQPSYSAGVLTFDGIDDHLTTAGQISIVGDFTIGVVINPTSYTGAILADKTTGGEFIKFFDNTSIRFKIDSGANTDLSLDSGTFAQSYMVYTRNSGTMSLWYNGVLQADTETLSGTADIDSIGIRYPSNSPLDGTIEEVQIFSSYSSDLASNVNSYLAAL
tara:strand:+ start:1124 stop:1801 length:678 start_codon:yes stop_codon:yes gene_type:complete